MTSNLGTETIERACGGDRSPSARELVQEVRPLLASYFKPALLGRMTVVPYRPLSQAVMGRIVNMKLARVRGRLKSEHGVHLRVTDAAREAILARCDDPASGARNIDHVLDEAVLPQISQELLVKMAEGHVPDRLTLGARKNELTFHFGAAPAPRKKREERATAPPAAEAPKKRTPPKPKPKTEPLVVVAGAPAPGG